MDIIYPTSSNPPTYGHADLINRVCKKFNKIYWVAAESYEKKIIFPKEIRLAMIEYLDHFSGTCYFRLKYKKSLFHYRYYGFP